MSQSGHEVVERYDAWWEGRNDEPVVSVIYPKENADFSELIKPWMSPPVVNKWSPWQNEFIFGQAIDQIRKDGDWSHMDEALDILEKYPDVTGNLREGYSFLHICLGPGALTPYITDYFKFQDTTIWLEPETDWEWDAILQIDENTRSPYSDQAEKGTGMAVERLSGKYTFSAPDFTGPLDILSSIRGNQNLLMDLMLEPDKVAEANERIESLWRKVYKTYSDIVNPPNNGLYTMVFRYLSSKPAHTAICDFSALIGPDHFRQFAVPTIERDAEMFPGRLAYHMDGPDQIKHLDALLEIDGLRVLQWVPGAGASHCCDPEWDDLYKKTLDAGKQIALSSTGSLEEIKALFKRFPAKSFLLPIAAGSREEAEEAVRIIEQA